jgi:hypothetical protein
MMHFLTGVSRYCTGYPAIAPAQAVIIDQQDGLVVEVDPTPIGGYRSSFGALTIRAEDNTPFSLWSKERIKRCALFEQKILKILEAAGISNTLIYLTEELIEEFQSGLPSRSKLSLIPYPKCNRWEKVQGAWHVIFGAGSLTQEQVNTIAKQYQEQWEKSGLGRVDTQKNRPQSDSFEQSQKTDPFCNPEILKKQRIIEKTLYETPFSILCDRRPMGDSHQLIVPTPTKKKQLGEVHQDGSLVSSHLREEAMMLTQKTIAQLLRNSAFWATMIVERNGKKLKSVPHFHVNVHGLLQPLEGCWQKIQLLMGMAWRPALSDQQLKKEIEKHQQTVWKD